MGDLLYLDTARLGRMSPGARRAHHDFVELAGEEGGSAYFERFLRAGLSSLPTNFQTRYPGLSGWHGAPALTAALRHLVGDGRTDFPVLLANRSAQVMKLAARLLFHPCRNVLTTDLDWPSYHEVLLAESRRANRTVTVAELRRAVRLEGAGEDELVRRLKAEFVNRGCDGLFITAVSSDGIRLPVERIVSEIESTQQVWFTAVDGAQDFCHAGADIRHCDLYLAGAHKWLGAYLPLGMGFYGRLRSRGMVETVLAQMAATGDIDDPLLRAAGGLAAGGLAAGSFAGLAETTNLAPLFSCQGAVDELASRCEAPPDRLAGRLANRAVAAELAAGEGWLPRQTDPRLRTGILLLDAMSAAAVGANPDAVRSHFRDSGVSVSAYQGGAIRLSMPTEPWSENDLRTLRDALREGETCGVR